jgi:hypothetical protein
MVFGNALDAIARILRIAINRRHEPENLIFAGRGLSKDRPREIDGLSDYKFVRH